MSCKLDMTLREGDKVVFNTSAGYSNVHAEVLSVEGKIAHLRYRLGRFGDFAKTDVPLKDIQFSCHHHDAPFTSYVLDEELLESDGYHSGLAIGLTGQFYQAGGPWVSKVEGRDCRHWRQYVEFQKRNNAAFRKGWAAGQERAKMKKPLDFTKPLRTVKDHKPVFYVGPINPDGEDHMVNIAYDNGPPPRYGQLPIAIDKFGSQGHGHHENVVENVPEPFSYGEVIDTPAGPVSLNITVLDGEVTSVEWVQ